MYLRIFCGRWGCVISHALSAAAPASKSISLSMTIFLLLVKVGKRNLQWAVCYDDVRWHVRRFNLFDDEISSIWVVQSAFNVLWCILRWLARFRQSGWSCCSTEVIFRAWARTLFTGEWRQLSYWSYIHTAKKLLNLSKYGAFGRSYTFGILMA